VAVIEIVFSRGVCDVSLDPRLSAPSERVSAIENELPSYRAVSALAVTSMVFGALTIFSFADIWFLGFGVLAIVLGVLAQRKIRRFPDLLTGKGMAQVGIALGLVFSVSAATISETQSLKIRQSAMNFSRQYTRILNSSNLAQATWYRLPYASRKVQTAEEFLSEITKQSARDPMMGETYTGPIKAIQRRVQEQGWSIRLLELERYGYDRLTPFAFACLELTPPAGSKGNATEHALLELRSDEHARALNWHVQEMVYPYTPKSHQLKVKIDDGHNH
jgi:hypothetical protein